MRPARLLFLCLTSAAALTPRTGRAQPVLTAPATSAVDPGIAEDPNGDRSVVMPTALTQPAGTLTLSDYDIFLAGLTYGISDQLQVGLDTMLVGGSLLSDDSMLLGTAKWQFLRSGNLRLAALGALIYSSQSQYALPGEGDSTPTRRLRPHLGLSASVCMTEDCRSVLTGNLVTSLYRDRGSVHAGRFMYSVSATFGLFRHLKGVVEYDQDAQMGGQGDVSKPLFSTALRLCGRHLAADAGVMLFGESGGGYQPLPFLSGTFRL